MSTSKTVYYALAVIQLFCASAFAVTAADTANFIHKRLAGVPAPAADRERMIALISAGDYAGAAKIASAKPSFINATVREWSAPITNVAGDINIPFNDMQAMYMYAAKTGMDMRTAVFTGDYMVVCNENLITENSRKRPDRTQANRHYERCGEEVTDISAALEFRQPQRDAYFDENNGSFTAEPSEVPQSATAGMITSWQAGKQLFEAGTNRRPLHYIYEWWFCLPLKKVFDTAVSDQFVRHDVSRMPAGDPSQYLQNCTGCHTWMGAMVRAFSYFDFRSDRFRYQNSPQQKMLKNNIYSAGFTPSDNRWDQISNPGPLSVVGWNGKKSGQGLRDLASVLALADAFPMCMARRVYQKVCRKSEDELEGDDNDEIRKLSSSFKAGGYNLKTLFEEAAVSRCLPRPSN